MFPASFVKVSIGLFIRTIIAVAGHTWYLVASLGYPLLFGTGRKANVSDQQSAIIMDTRRFLLRWRVRYFSLTPVDRTRQLRIRILFVHNGHYGYRVKRLSCGETETTPGRCRRRPSDLDAEKDEKRAPTIPSTSGDSKKNHRSITKNAVGFATLPWSKIRRVFGVIPTRISDNNWLTGETD